MRIEDQCVLALTVWRENRSGALNGMQSVANVIQNRAAKHKTTAYSECVKPLQFSSMTAKGDAELALWPAEGDSQWIQAKDLAAKAAAGALIDLTHGATLYYAPKGLTADETRLGRKWTLPSGEQVAFPDSWNAAAVAFAAEIAGQLFFRGV